MNWMLLEFIEECLTLPEDTKMTINLKPIARNEITFTIRGISPLIQHAWSAKAKKQMADKHAGKKTKTREIRDPEQEFKDAIYHTKSGEYGIPAMAFKRAVLSAAHKDIGIEKTLLRKSFFILCNDAEMILPMECDEPEMREDCVRVGMGSSDLRYRPEFKKWSVAITAGFDAEMLKPEDIVNIVNRAGFGVGIGEWRPEKSGDNGRFEIDTNKPVEVSQ